MFKRISMKESIMTTSPIIEFYAGTGTATNNRTLATIQGWDHRELDVVHDFVQWMFPLTERSEVIINAPVLTHEDIGIFNTDKALQGNLLKSFRVMLDFYGFELGESITLAPNFEERSNVWISQNNHNYYRISRILQSLMLLGLGHYAERFYVALSKVHAEHPDKMNEAYIYWTDLMY